MSTLPRSLSTRVLPTVHSIFCILNKEYISVTVTFEDKRKENFDKGAAELEKRRQALKEMQEKEEAERLAHEKAEQEKREKQRFVALYISGYIIYIVDFFFLLNFRCPIFWLKSLQA